MRLSTKQTHAAFTAALFFGVVFSETAQAKKPLPVWELGAGLVGADLPDYRGSAHHHRYFLPVPYGIFRGERLRVGRDQSRFRLLEGSTFAIDWSLTASPPANSDENPAREGMPDLALAIEWGPQLKWTIDDHWSLRSRVHLASTLDDNGIKEHGVIFSQAIQWETSLPHHLRLGLNVAALGGSDRYHDYYYAVEPQFATPERETYEGSAGFSGWNSTVTLSRRTSKSLYGFFLRANSLDGAIIEDSPLVDDKHSWAAGFAVAWIMLTSEESVSAR